MRKPIALFLIINFMVILLTVLYSFAAEERLVLTTYYPAPYGVYKEMRVDQMTVGSAYRYSGGLNDGYLFVDGRVGIGTTVPAVKLEVVENSYQFAGIRLTNNRIGAGNYSYIDAVVAAESAGDPAFRLRVTSGTGDWWSIGERNSDNNKLYISKGSDLSNPKLVIDSSGNVGIGTTSPRAELEVHGPIIFLTGNETLLWDSKHVGTNDFRNYLAPMNSSGTYWDWNQEFGYHWGNRAWYFDGDVGIGTNNPGAKLDVEVNSGGAATIGGSSNLATGNFAVAMGVGSNATGNISTAMGQLTNANGQVSFAVGKDTTAGGDFSTVAGGETNEVTGSHSAILGGKENRISSSPYGSCSVIGGGSGNSISGHYNAILGGIGNSASLGTRNTVSGGSNNSASSTAATVSGGEDNHATNGWTTVSGGYYNFATGNTATVLGGMANTASGTLSTVVGGSMNTASGMNSLAAGGGANAIHNGSFVFNCGGASYGSNANNSFNVRATGGIYLSGIGDVGSVSTYGLRYNTSTGRLYYDTSSLRYKKDIHLLKDDYYRILKLEPKSFSYKESGDKDIGYIAEELDELGLKKLVIYDVKNNPDAIRYDKISIYLLEIIKDQQKRIDKLEEEIKEIKEKN